MIKAIIFDLDGVLVDATEWHYEALNEALMLFGFEISLNEHKTTYNGLPTLKKLEKLTAEKELPKGLYKIVQIMKRKFTDNKVALNCKPKYEKQLLLSNLKKAGFKLAACSNAQKYSVINMLEKSQIIEYFDEILGNDEGFNPKPSPDIYIAMYKMLKIKPREALVIEDSFYGIEAASASGANVITVKDSDEVNLSLFEDLL